MVTPHVGHKYAVVKLYPGIDETIFGKLLNGLGLEVFYTNDLNCNQTEEEEVPWSYTEVVTSQPVGGDVMRAVSARLPLPCSTNGGHPFRKKTASGGKAAGGVSPSHLYCDPTGHDDTNCNFPSGAVKGRGVSLLNQDGVIAPSVPPIAQTWNDELAIREWMTLIEFIEKNVSVDLKLNNPGPSLNDASVQTSEPETVTPSAEDDAPKTITCMLCQEEVPRDKKSLRAHVQTHSGKRYGCSRCKYHTDRKFDFTRHIRRRHEGKPDPEDGGSRPHWMSLLRSCFPNYGEVMRFRRPKRPKVSTDEKRQIGNCAQQQSNESPFAAVPSTAGISPVVC